MLEFKYNFYRIDLDNLCGACFINYSKDRVDENEKKTPTTIKTNKLDNKLIKFIKIDLINLTQLPKLIKN